MQVESITIRNTERARFLLPPGFVVLVSGSGDLLHGVDNMSRIKLRPEDQTLGPFPDTVKVEVRATDDTTYALYDLNNIDAADLGDLATLAPGTKAWAIDGPGRSERYWDGTDWVPNSFCVVGTLSPNDGDGRPDGTVYFQI